MAKLKGKAKADFLKRMRLGRLRKSAKKRDAKRSKSSKKARIRKPNKPNRRKTNVARKGRKALSRAGKFSMQKIKQGAIGGVSGTATTAILKRLGVNGLADDVGYVVASLVGKTPGVIGTAVIKQGLSRFGGSLGFLGSGNGNGAQNTGGFA